MHDTAPAADTPRAALKLGNAAARCAHKIRHPPSRFDKLGIKAELAIQLVGNARLIFWMNSATPK